MLNRSSDRHQTNVGIAELAISDNTNDILVAPNLGSCLGITAYDPQKRIGGLVHCLLPMSKSDPEKAKQRPAMYVDSGLVLLLNSLITKGAEKSRLILCVGGGSQINDENGVFEIGKRNHTVFRKVLWKNNLLIKGEHIGGNSSRTVYLDIETGRVWIKTNGEIITLFEG